MQVVVVMVSYYVIINSIEDWVNRLRNPVKRQYRAD